MIFQSLPIEDAEGMILGHNVTDREGRRRLRKGRALSKDDIAVLRLVQQETVWVARLEAGDLEENACAHWVAKALLQPATAEQCHLECLGPRTGRLNFKSSVHGVLHVDQDQVHAINAWQGITFATSSPFSVVTPGTTVATTKILPYALPMAHLDSATASLVDQPAVKVLPLRRQRVVLLVCGHTAGKERTVSSFKNSLNQRIVNLGSELAATKFIANDAAEGAAAPLTAAIRHAGENFDLVLLAGETAIQDPNDIAPAAVRAAGGEVTCFGAPVDPGNLLLLAHIGKVPILGVPGCARSAKPNIVDLVLPRLLVGEQITPEDINRLGVGGLLEDVPERPLPRHQI